MLITEKENFLIETKNGKLDQQRYFIVFVSNFYVNDSLKIHDYKLHF